MSALRPQIASAAARIATRTSRRTVTPASLSTAATTTISQSRACSQCRSVKDWKENHAAWSRVQLGSQQLRSYASEGKSLADEQVEKITELFNTAKDEFELAYEETEKKTVYAINDREAAEAAFKKMEEAYALVLQNSSPEVAAEIRKRIDQGIRELKAGMQRMHELSMKD